MTSKTDLWDRLGKTDPSHTKQFKRSGGFSGTAIKPMWSYRRMTEEYGPCGEGWGVNEPSFQVVSGPEGEVLVYCTVSIWHGARDRTVFGVGADVHMGMFDDSKYVNERKQDEARKDSTPADNESHLAYIAKCREMIRKATDPAALATWWNDQKQARRDFELTQAEIDDLKKFIVARRDQLNSKEAA